jgi:hypothetical protein
MLCNNLIPQPHGLKEETHEKTTFIDKNQQTHMPRRSLSMASNTPKKGGKTGASTPSPTKRTSKPSAKAIAIASASLAETETAAEADVVTEVVTDGDDSEDTEAALQDDMPVHVKPEKDIAPPDGTLHMHGQILFTKSFNVTRKLSEEPKWELRKSIAPPIITHICDELIQNSSFNAHEWTTAYLQTHHNYLRKPEIKWMAIQSTKWTNKLTELHNTNTFYHSQLSTSNLKRANSITETISIGSSTEMMRELTALKTQYRQVAAQITVLQKAAEKNATNAPYQPYGKAEEAIIQKMARGNGLDCAGLAKEARDTGIPHILPSLRDLRERQNKMEFNQTSMGKKMATFAPRIMVDDLKQDIADLNQAVTDTAATVKQNNKAVPGQCRAEMKKLGQNYALDSDFRDGLQHLDSRVAEVSGRVTTLEGLSDPGKDQADMEEDSTSPPLAVPQPVAVRAARPPTVATKSTVATKPTAVTKSTATTKTTVVTKTTAALTGKVTATQQPRNPKRAGAPLAAAYPKKGVGVSAPTNAPPPFVCGPVRENTTMDQAIKGVMNATGLLPGIKRSLYTTTVDSFEAGAYNRKIMLKNLMFHKIPGGNRSAQIYATEIQDLYNQWKTANNGEQADEDKDEAEEGDELDPDFGLDPDFD